MEATSKLDNIDSWLADQWIRTYGKETTEKIVEAAMCQSPIFITINHSHGRDEEIAATAQQERVINKLEIVKDKFTEAVGEDSDEQAEILPIGSIRVPDSVRGRVSEWPLYETGAWWVQDLSATLPATALFNSLSANREKRIDQMHVVDLCSAPGGKAAQLCSMGFGKVDAVEISPRRSRSLHQNLKRLGMANKCNVVVEDGRKFKPGTLAGTSYVDGVLVDAPCSATGVISRRPDVLRKSIELEELVSMQRELLSHAANNILEVGGVLVYATCSLLKQEGEDQIANLLMESFSTLEVVPFTHGEIPGFDDCIDKNGWLRVIPGVLPGSLQFCDGFFVARLRKMA